MPQKKLPSFLKKENKYKADPHSECYLKHPDKKIWWRCAWCYPGDTAPHYRQRNWTSGICPFHLKNSLMKTVSASPIFLLFSFVVGIAQV